MCKQRLVSGRREGFTLAEMLVAMALLAVLAAVVVPSILRQVGKGDATRVTAPHGSAKRARLARLLTWRTTRWRATESAAC